MVFMVANQLKAAARLIDEEFMRGEHAAMFCTPNGRWWPSNVKLTTKAWEENKGLIASEDITELLARILIARDALAKMIDKLDDTYAQLIGVRSPNDPMGQADRRPLKE